MHNETNTRTNEQTEQKSQVPTTKINNFHWIFFSTDSKHTYMLYVVVKKVYIALSVVIFFVRWFLFGSVCVCVCQSAQNYSNKNLYNYV